MKTLGYYNGKYDEIEKMTVPMNDRACYFGDGVYDATYSRNYKLFALDEHIDRFFNSAAKLEIDLGITKGELKSLLNRLVKKLDSGSQFVYWQATRGTGERNHAFPGGKANLWVTLRECEIDDIYKKIKVTHTEDTRYFHCDIKTLNLIPNCMAIERAEKMGCYESIFHRGERVTECAHSNVSIIKDGVFITAPVDNLILPGTARARLISSCGKFGIPVVERPYTMDELMNADEVIVSSTGSFCLAVESVDGVNVGGKAPELLKKLQDDVLEEFMRMTE